MKDNTKEMFLVKENEFATLYFNRPNKRNAINSRMWRMLSELLAEVESDSTIKVLILRGVDNSAFSSGADISEFKEVRSNDKQATEYNREAKNAVDRLTKFPKPTIAMIQGYCVGGGCELALTCDFRFTDSSGKFGITPARLGIIYGLDATKRLSDLVGPVHTKDILMSARIIDADEAFGMGLVDKIFTSDDLLEKTHEYADLISRRSQLSVRATKKIVGEILNGVVTDTDEIKEMVLNSYNSEDYKEGVNAFQEKRKPNFKYS